MQRARPHPRSIEKIFSTKVFFWQASQEAEDVRALPHRRILKRAPEQGEAALERIGIDTLAGMAISNLIAAAIMITAAATLHAHNVTEIETSAQAAEALRPIAGSLAEMIFALGVIGTGLLSVRCWRGRPHMPSERHASGRSDWH